MEEENASVTPTPVYEMQVQYAEPAAAPVPAAKPDLPAYLIPGPGRFKALEVTFIRELEDSDLLDVLDGAPVSGPASLATIRHAHHRIAQLLVEGKPPSMVSLITGYTPGRISALQNDPVFNELLAYYAGQVEQVHVDTLERMKVLNLTAMEELSERLETDPASWTKRDLMDLAKLTTPLAVPAANSGPSSASGPQIALNVQFVTPEHSQSPAAAPTFAGKIASRAPETEI